jgi:hypothetical protein
MEIVHVFVALGRFTSDAELQAFVDPTYTEDGDLVPSQFMRETGLSHCEPAAIERVHCPTPLPVRELLRGSSYDDQWLQRVDASLVAESAICVFGPNMLGQPQSASMQYAGAFHYRVPSTSG